MSTEDKRRYFWLKLDKGFFKRHDIKIIESLDNGKEYVLFYLKLLCEATSHEGELRFSKAVPYDYKMLSIVTETNVDIVKSAMEIFIQLGLIKIADDDTIIMTEMGKMIGSETHAAKRKRAQREQKGDNVPLLSQNCRTEKEKEKEKELEKDCSGSGCDIWKALTSSEIDTLYDNYEKAGDLIQEVYEDVRDKGKEIEAPFLYVIGYARKKGWPKCKNLK
jgi:predicted phage replisome organizer